MKKNIINKFIFAGLAALAFTACSEPDDEITSNSYSRNFSPVNLEARVVNQTQIRVNWTPSEGATSYNLEVYNDSMQFTGSPVKTATVIASELPVTLKGFEGEENYSIRVQAITEGNDSRTSKWTGIAVQTGREQIFADLTEADLTNTSVTLHWPAGERADYITIKPGDIRHDLTDAEIAAGTVTIDGLTDDTDYTAVMTRGSKTRGTMKFTTPLNLNGATKIEAGTDLAAAIAAAADGEVLALMPGEYTVGADAEAAYKYGSLAISKNLTIRSAKSSDRAIIRGRFQISAGASLDLNQIVLNGQETSGDQAFNYTEDGEYDHLNVQDCEIFGFTKGFYYVNKAAKINDITINNCLIHDIECSGGDMFDCRAGAILKINITNSTIWHCALERDFVRYDDKSSNFEGVQPQITIDHCTLNDVSNLAGKRILYVRFAGNSITFTNNIVSNTLANFSNQSSTAVPTFENNNYWNAAALNAEGGAGKFIDTTGRELDPGYANAAGGDFTVSNEDVKFYGIGDPRWTK